MSINSCKSCLFHECLSITTAISDGVNVLGVCFQSVHDRAIGEGHDHEWKDQCEQQIGQHKLTRAADCVVIYALVVDEVVHCELVRVGVSNGKVSIDDAQQPGGCDQFIGLRLEPSA